MNETHNGNLNRSKAPMPAEAEGTKSAGKSNGPESTLRSGNLPKSEAVLTAVKENKGACVKAAQKQNSSDGKPYKTGRNVIPNTGTSLDIDVNFEVNEEHEEEE